jgi:tetratricopeptide (TPR) repeat protein
MMEFNEAIRLNPTASDYIGRGLVWLQKGDIDQTTNEFTEAIRLGPNDAIADAATYYNRGKAYYNKGEYDLAIADLTKAIELQPDYASVFQPHNDGSLIPDRDRNPLFG